MTSKIPIITNSHASEGEKAPALAKLLELPEYSRFFTVPFDPNTLGDTISQLAVQGHTSIACAGGDGTVSQVAGAILGRGMPVRLGVIPMGTFNHLAKDLRIPPDLKESLDIIVSGKSAYIDVAKVNDVYFVNNSSLGLYPKIVRERDEIQKKGWGKSFALIGACISILRNHNPLLVEFQSENKKISRKTPFIFIGNNKYELSGFDIGGRKLLDEGVFLICVAKNVSRMKFLVFGLKAILGTLVLDKDFDVIGLKELTITSKAGSVDVSHDGEITRLRTPLHYEMLPRALSVIIP